MTQRRGLSVCSTPGCPELVTSGRCDKHQADADRRRGTSAQRGYGHRHRVRFRAGVLAKHPICVACRTAPSTVADHHPLSRRDLVHQGLDPDDPVYGRGLCKSCHDRYTARAQPGGWNA